MVLHKMCEGYRVLCFTSSSFKGCTRGVNLNLSTSIAKGGFQPCQEKVYKIESKEGVKERGRERERERERGIKGERLE